MFIAKVKSHNYINGYWFSAIEFSLASFVVAPFSYYYLAHNRIIFGILSIGLIMNFLVIVGFAVESIIQGERGLGMAFYRDRRVREKIASQYPYLGRDTIMLCVGFLIPFYLATAIYIETAHRNR
ncbi:hypothetical protein HJC99_00350 [Candidatus Saccharibacteria bacterium]|nr:hypothetical protein [Candidatus Saccharibacteria bacterium]